MNLFANQIKWYNDRSKQIEGQLYIIDTQRYIESTRINISALRRWLEKCLLTEKTEESIVTIEKDPAYIFRSRKSLVPRPSKFALIDKERS